MLRDNPSQTTLDLLYAAQNRLLEDPLGHAIHRVIALDVAGIPQIGWLRQRVSEHKTAQMFAGPFTRIPPTHGEIVVGNDLKGRPIRIPVQSLCSHILTLGGSGSGKTTKSRWMILQAARFVSGLWMFDFRKREYRCLVPWLEAIGLETIVVPARMLRLNPMQVPFGVDARAWASRVADMLVQVFRLPQRGTKLLNLTMLDLFERFGVTNGSTHYPTLFDLREAIANNREANAQARSAVVDALDPVLVSIREVLCYRRGWSTGDLAKYRIVFEFDGVAEVEKDLLLSSLVLPEFTTRVASGVSNAQMNLLVCCDEAARLVSTSGSGGGIGDLIGLIRGTGIGLELSVQTADISSAILSNTATKFIGRCGSSADYHTMSESMGLTVEQKRLMAQTLVPGMFVGQFGEGDWRKPFLYRVPLVDLSKLPKQTGGSVSPVIAGLLPVGDRCDTSDNGGLGTLLSLPTEVASEFVNWSPGGTTTRGAAKADVDSTPDPTLSDAEVRFLKAVIANPAQPSSAYAKLAGIGTHQSIAARTRLVGGGFLKEHKVNMSGGSLGTGRGSGRGRGGRGSIILEPTATAMAAVGNQTEGDQ